MNQLQLPISTFISPFVLKLSRLHSGHVILPWTPLANSLRQWRQKLWKLRQLLWISECSHTHRTGYFIMKPDCRLRSFYPWKTSKKSVKYCLGWTCQSGWSNLVICRGKERTRFFYCHAFLQFWPIIQSSLTYTYF